MRKKKLYHPAVTTLMRQLQVTALPPRSLTTRPRNENSRRSTYMITLMIILKTRLP